MAYYVVSYPLSVKYTGTCFNYIYLHNFTFIPKVLNMIIVCLFGSHKNCVLVLRIILQGVNFDKIHNQEKTTPSS